METNTGLEIPPDTRGDMFGEQPARSHSWRKRVMMTGVAALAALGVGWKYLERPEGVEHIKPLVHRVAIIDNILKVGSWNMHGQAAERAGQIHKLASGLDALALQEVARNDIPILEEAMPEYHIAYKVADKKQHILEGGYGDAIITRQEPRDLDARIFKGTSLATTATRTVAGVATDIIDGNTGLTNTRDGMQENRAAVAETIKVYSSGKLIDVRLITAHLASHLDPGVHDRQLNGLLKYVKANTKPGRPTVFMGDLNAGSTEIIPAFASIGFVSPDTAATSVTSKRTIDHLAYYVTAGLGLAKTKVLPDPRTDHYPLEAEWDLKP
jgi:endonuclease/exonuclease/phosphatase family metal-dependent hydrolase